MSTHVPLISSGTAGPLGVLHLPRLWQKVSLEAAGKLAAGYPGCGKGYDQMTCDALGLEHGEKRNEVRQTCRLLGVADVTLDRYHGHRRPRPLGIPAHLQRAIEDLRLHGIAGSGASAV